MYTPYAGTVGMLISMNGKSTVGKLKHFYCRKVVFLTAPHWQFGGVGQGMKQTYLYLWYPLLQAELDRCDQRNHQTYKYLVKGHHLAGEAPVWSLPHTNKGTSRQEEEHSLYPNVCRLSVEKHVHQSDKYVVNKKLEHVDDISFRELCGRIRVLFTK